MFRTAHQLVFSLFCFLYLVIFLSVQPPVSMPPAETLTRVSSKERIITTPSFAFVWFLHLAFVIHDGEEVLTMASWIRGNEPLLQKIASSNSVVAYAIANLPTHWTEVAGAATFELLLLLSEFAKVFSQIGTAK